MSRREYERDEGSSRKRQRHDEPEELPEMYSIFTGEVASIQAYGAFIKIPGYRKNGLVHKSQISSTRVEDVAEVLALGDQVFCKVISHGEDGKGKISLSMKVVNQGDGRDLDPNRREYERDEEGSRKRQRHDEQEELPEMYSIFTGEVASIQAYGAFIKIPGYRKNGLVHKSQISSTRVEDVAEVLALGDQVFCKVISHGEDGNGKISLSMKVVNQGDGRDLDPNLVTTNQEEMRKKKGGSYVKPRIELGAVLNTVCKQCGTKGHLSQNCFQAPGSKSYELLPELDLSAPPPEELQHKKEGHKKKKNKKEKKKHKKMSKKKHKHKHVSSDSDSDSSDSEPDSPKRHSKKQQRKHRESSSSSTSDFIEDEKSKKNRRREDRGHKRKERQDEDNGEGRRRNDREDSDRRHIMKDRENSDDRGHKKTDRQDRDNGDGHRRKDREDSDRRHMKDRENSDGRGQKRTDRQDRDNEEGHRREDSDRRHMKDRENSDDRGHKRTDRQDRDNEEGHRRKNRDSEEGHWRKDSDRRHRMTDREDGDYRVNSKKDRQDRDSDDRGHVRKERQDRDRDDRGHRRRDKEDMDSDIDRRHKPHDKDR